IETVLHLFGPGVDGSEPFASLTYDPITGNLYGTTLQDGPGDGSGTVFKLTPSPWTFTQLYAFPHFADGYLAYSPVIWDSSGNLYGTTANGGAYRSGEVYEITP